MCRCRPPRHRGGIGIAWCTWLVTLRRFQRRSWMAWRSNVGQFDLGSSLQQKFGVEGEVSSMVNPQSPDPIF